MVFTRTGILCVGFSRGWEILACFFTRMATVALFSTRFFCVVFPREGRFLRCFCMKMGDCCVIFHEDAAWVVVSPAFTYEVILSACGMCGRAGCRGDRHPHPRQTRQLRNIYASSGLKKRPCVPSGYIPGIVWL